MPIYKSVSLDKSKFTDVQISDKCGSVGFVSFERAIIETLAYNRLERKVIGYRVTDKGIEMMYE
jgi:hypothetical protein